MQLHPGTGFPRLELRIRLCFARNAQHRSFSRMCPHILSHSIHKQHACLAHIRRSIRSYAKLQFADAAVRFLVGVFGLTHCWRLLCCWASKGHSHRNALTQYATHSKVVRAHWESHLLQRSMHSKHCTVHVTQATRTTHAAQTTSQGTDNNTWHMHQNNHHNTHTTQHSMLSTLVVNSVLQQPCRCTCGSVLMHTSQVLV